MVSPSKFANKTNLLLTKHLIFSHSSAKNPFNKDNKKVLRSILRLWSQLNKLVSRIIAAQFNSPGARGDEGPSKKLRKSIGICPVPRSGLTRHEAMEQSFVIWDIVAFGESASCIFKVVGLKGFHHENWNENQLQLRWFSLSGNY